MWGPRRKQWCSFDLLETPDSPGEVWGRSGGSILRKDSIWKLIGNLLSSAGFPGSARVKNPPASAGDVGAVGSIPGLGRSPRGGHGNPLQYSCLENPMDRGVWWATVHRLTRSQTWLKRLSMHVAHTSKISKGLNTWLNGITDQYETSYLFSNWRKLSFSFV